MSPGSGGGRELTPGEVGALLAGCEGDSKRLASAVRELYGRAGRRFSVRAGEAVVAALEEASAEGPDGSGLLALAEDSAAPSSPLSLWVRARLRGLLGDARAAEAWDAFLGAAPAVVPEAHLHRARARLRAGEAQGAAADLRLALQEATSYELWSRAEKTERRLRRKHELPASRTLRVAVLSGKASTALLAPLLRVACFRDGMRVELYEGDYDRWQQDVLDPTSGLYRFEPDVVLLPLHWRDAELPAFASDPGARVQEAADRLLELWTTLRERSRAAVVAHGLDLPQSEAYGLLSSSLDGGRIAMLRALNERLRREKPEGVVLIDLEHVAASVPPAPWEDPRRWVAARQHPAPEALVTLVERHAAALRAVAGLSRKVVALDLDNTLWGGVVGEEGLENIVLGPPSATGESFQDFQRYLRSLRERGVLLVVNSKNNEEDARQPFERHPEAVLALDDFVSFKANWNDKAANLREIAEELSLGLDSFVFLDDNPVERAWVRSQLPEVVVPELPDDPALFVPRLERQRYFEAVSLSKEDRERHASYRANAERARVRTKARSLEGFLAELQMVAQRGPFDATNLPRITQLVNKTNQFNLTARRYTREQLEAQADDPSWWTQWFRLRDRFEDSGLIGVMTCKPREGEADALEIDNWLMSCRVLGRQMELYMLRAAMEDARAGGFRRLYGRFLPTAKNAQVRDLFPKLAFEAVSGAEGEETVWVLDLETASLPECRIETECD